MFSIRATVYSILLQAKGLKVTSPQGQSEFEPKPLISIHKTVFFGSRRVFLILEDFEPLDLQQHNVPFLERSHQDLF